MSYIIGSKCVSVCDTACVAVCPVDCIHGPLDKEGMGMEVENMSKEEIQNQQLYINPEDCIECGACLPECPVEAIWADDELPAEQIPFIEINEKGAEMYRENNITEQKESMAHESPYSVEDAIKVVQID